jgi:PAS domain S-box-containing protein
MSAAVNILLVDDEPRNLDALESILESPGYRLVRARSAEEALLALLHEEFAAIVLDIKMPGTSGLELAELIKKRRRTQHVPILFLTAYTVGEHDVLRAYGAGGVDYLSKPFAPEILRSKIAVFADLSRTARALAAANVALESEIAERRRTQQALHEANTALEAGVKERTAELTRANQALRESETRLRMAAEVAGTVVAVIEHPSGHIRGGPDLARLLGLPEDDVLLSPEQARAIIHPDDLERVLQRMASALTQQGTGTFESEHRIVVADGTAYWVDVRARTFFEGEDAARRPVRTLLVLLDITARKRIDEERALLLKSERAARAEAERANRLKDEFLATLSHELRTPLNSILGWAQLMKERRMSDGEVARGIDVIERNSRTQAQMIEDLLDMSRIVSGKFSLVLGPVDPASIVRSAVESIRPAARNRGLGLETAIDGRVGCVQGDPSRLQQVMSNLLTNAVKFTPRGGVVRVSVRRLAGGIAIEVTDTGRGISPHFLPHVFERFRQADSSTTRTFGGLGIGLAIVRSLVELHGGTVDAESAGEGSGACFRVVLPALCVPETPDPREPEASGSGSEALSLRGICVLMVEDDQDASDLVRRILEGCEARVVSASCVREALQLLSRERPSVIVSDIGMPDEDGYDLIRQVRAMLPEDGGRTPAVALTALARPEDRQRVLLAGYDAHLAKPVESTQLIARVASLGSTRSPLSAQPRKEAS